jgi:hypothetical protein
MGILSAVVLLWGSGDGWLSSTLKVLNHGHLQCFVLTPTDCFDVLLKIFSIFSSNYQA